MKKFFTLILMTLLPVLANAYNAEIDGIYYNFSGNEAIVTYRNTSNNSYSGAIVIPESVTYNGNTYSVTCIGNSAFSGCSSLTSITIPNSVTSIGSSAFYGCSSLTSITIPNSVTSISVDTFNCCSSLTSITIPNSVTSIGSFAFYGCTGLKKVIVPDIAAWCGISFGGYDANPLSYAHHIFSDENTEITDLIIPEGVPNIGGGAFYGCNSITSVTIGNSVTSIGSSAFSGCSSMTYVTIPNSVTTI